MDSTDTHTYKRPREFKEEETSCASSKPTKAGMYACDTCGQCGTLATEGGTIFRSTVPYQSYYCFIEHRVMGRFVCLDCKNLSQEHFRQTIVSMFLTTDPKGRQVVMGSYFPGPGSVKTRKFVLDESIPLIKRAEILYRKCRINGNINPDVLLHDLTLSPQIRILEDATADESIKPWNLSTLRHSHGKVVHKLRLFRSLRVLRSSPDTDKSIYERDDELPPLPGLERLEETDLPEGVGSR